MMIELLDPSEIQSICDAHNSKSSWLQLAARAMNISDAPGRRPHAGAAALPVAEEIRIAYVLSD